MANLHPVRLRLSCGETFTADARITMGALKPVPERPYLIQDGKFRVYTDGQIVPGDTINEWVVTSVFRAKGRRFCDAVRFELLQPSTVDLLEIHKVAGVSPMIRAEAKLQRVKSGVMTVNDTAETSDERRIRANSVLFTLEPTDLVITPERWQVLHKGGFYLVTGVLDAGVIGKLPTLITAKDVRR